VSTVSSDSSSEPTGVLFRLTSTTLMLPSWRRVKCSCVLCVPVNVFCLAGSVHKSDFRCVTN
jgi:hypothetical protein